MVINHILYIASAWQGFIRAGLESIDSNVLVHEDSFGLVTCLR